MMINTEFDVRDSIRRDRNSSLSLEGRSIISDGFRLPKVRGLLLMMLCSSRLTKSKKVPMMIFFEWSLI